MAKSKTRRGRSKAKAAHKRTSASRRVAKKVVRARPRAKTAAKTAARKRTTRRAPAAPVKTPRLNRARRTLDEVLPTPPSSLNMNRHGSAVRTGRAEMEQAREAHKTMTPAIAAGDVDVDVENAYF